MPKFVLSYETAWYRGSADVVLLNAWIYCSANNSFSSDNILYTIYELSKEYYWWNKEGSLYTNYSFVEGAWEDWKFFQSFSNDVELRQCLCIVGPKSG